MTELELEIECNYCDWFNIIFSSELEIKELFTCDNCENIILTT